MVGTPSKSVAGRKGRRMNGWPGMTHVCGECGFAYGPDPASSIETVASAVADISRDCTATSDEALRERPVEGLWSAIEYFCHVRDVLMVTAMRLYRTRTEDSPELEPMLNDVRAKFFRYNDSSPDVVAVESVRGVEAVRYAATQYREEDWWREGRRLGERRTARWLLQHAAHEVTHHKLDIRRVLAANPHTAPTFRPRRVRLARQSGRIDETVAFYRDQLHLQEITRFRSHDGYDGVVLDAGGGTHLEFVSTERFAPPAPHAESLIVLYLGSAENVSRLSHGLPVVGSGNRYWDQWGVTVQDPDGFRVVLVCGSPASA